MAGETTAVPVGAVRELMERAVEQGSVTPEEIAELLDTEGLSVTVEITWSIGDE